MWYLLLIIVWVAALASQWKGISDLGKLYFRVLSPHDGKTEKAMMLCDIVPMFLLFIAFYVIIRPIPAAAVALFRKFAGKSS